jgi:hypothetical protein
MKALKYERFRKYQNKQSFFLHLFVFFFVLVCTMETTEKKNIIDQLAGAVVAGEVKASEGHRTWNNYYLEVKKLGYTGPFEGGEVIEIYDEPQGNLIGSLEL